MGDRVIIMFLSASVTVYSAVGVSVTVHSAVGAINAPNTFAYLSHGIGVLAGLTLLVLYGFSRQR